MRLRHPAWFGKYNYIAGGGLDAGAKVMMFILTFAVAGGSGREIAFPTVSSLFLGFSRTSGAFHLHSLLSGGEILNLARRSTPITVVQDCELWVTTRRPGSP